MSRPTSFTHDTACWLLKQDGAELAARDMPEHLAMTAVQCKAAFYNVVKGAGLEFVRTVVNGKHKPYRVYKVDAKRIRDWMAHHRFLALRCGYTRDVKPRGPSTLPPAPPTSATPLTDAALALAARIEAHERALAYTIAAARAAPIADALRHASDDQLWAELRRRKEGRKC